jgi:hypothetical protein
MSPAARLSKTTANFALPTCNKWLIGNRKVSLTTPPILLPTANGADGHAQPLRLSWAYGPLANFA